ncbi:japanin-like-RS isoform X5 [Dermacentor variabilis]|uniref:japanin-like-RS isoform X5 n=1 Tax=Dermacentor variabilis TaxID=34621 RepID=UPI003F5B125C
MCIRLLATFALYAFVFASCCLAGNNSVAHEHHRYVLPANSTDTLYLIGYSLDLFNWNLTCVRTSFIRREGEVVYRNLTFNYTEEFNKTLPEEMTFQLQVKVPDTPIMFNLEVNATEKAKCSVWVKENFTLESNIPFMTNLSFQTNCKSPEYFGYLDTCGKS